jgi:PAS domain S-box-containing protein
MVSAEKQTSKSEPGVEVARLTKELQQLHQNYTKVLMEKNFLGRAMGDLNFHNNAHDGVIYTDSDNRIIYTNPYFLQMMGIEEGEEILHSPFPDYMWEDPSEAERLLADIASDGFVREREVQLNNRKGKPVFAMCSGVVSKDEDGNVLGTEIMLCNITGKRSVEAQLNEQYALLDAMLRSTPDPVLVLNAPVSLERQSRTRVASGIARKARRPGRHCAIPASPVRNKRET